MKTALIIHGTCDREEYFSDAFPSLSNSHWLPWLQKQMLIAGYVTQTPEMPNATMPRYREWSAELERYSVGSDSILVGHSCGGGFLLRWLSENPISLARLVLVAPWLDPSKSKDPSFFDFNMDEQMTLRTDVHILTSDNDSADINVSVEKIRAALTESKLHLFPGYGHFCLSDMGTAEFPELKKIALKGAR